MPKTEALPRQTILRSNTEYFKLNNKYVRYCAVATVISAIGHFLYLALGPAPEPKPYKLREKKIEVIDIPDEIYVPPPPPEVERPALPQEAEVSDDVDEEETVEETDYDPFEPPEAPPRTESNEQFVAFDEPPKAIRLPQPTYPDIARQSGAEGTVVVQVTIDETGRVVNAVVVQSDAIQSLQDAALKAAKSALFKPAKQRDVPVKSRIVLPYKFTLD